MNAWCFDRKVKPCSMLVQNIFTLPFSMPTYGREREYFPFVSKPKILPNYSHEHQIKDKQYFSKLISSFWKQMRRERISFPKRKTRSTPICKCTLFFQFSQNISKSILKLPFFYFYFDWDSSKSMREKLSWRYWKLVKPIRKPMSNAQW